MTLPPPEAAASYLAAIEGLPAAVPRWFIYAQRGAGAGVYRATSSDVARNIIVSRLARAGYAVTVVDLRPEADRHGAHVEIEAGL